MSERNRIMIAGRTAASSITAAKARSPTAPGRKGSGTALAWDYAVKRKKDIYNVSEIMCPENFLK